MYCTKIDLMLHAAEIFSYMTCFGLPAHNDYQRFNRYRGCTENIFSTMHTYSISKELVLVIFHYGILVIWYKAMSGIFIHARPLVDARCL